MTASTGRNYAKVIGMEAENISRIREAAASYRAAQDSYLHLKYQESRFRLQVILIATLRFLIVLWLYLVVFRDIMKVGNVAAVSLLGILIIYLLAEIIVLYFTIDRQNIFIRAAQDAEEEATTRYLRLTGASNRVELDRLDIQQRISEGGA